MLNGLDLVNWAELRHARGQASDIPALICSLLSPEQDIRDTATVSLFETIWHQGSVYEASSHAVPFLQELLCSDETPDKRPIALLLAELADGGSYIDAATQTGQMETLVRETLAGEGRDFEQERVQSRRFVEETRYAVGMQLPLLYPYLDCEIPDIRGAVARALMHYPERAAELTSILGRALARERDPEARQAMKEALAVLGAGMT